MSKLIARRISQAASHTRLRIASHTTTPSPFIPSLIQSRQIHESHRQNLQKKPKTTDPRENPAHDLTPPSDLNVGRKQFADFNLAGKVFVVTGGAQGLGLCLAEALVEAGGKVYCLDRAEKPDEGWKRAQDRTVPEWGGELLYRQQDVKDADGLDGVISEIADENQGLHGVIAAAGVQQITPAVDYKPSDVANMLAINFTGVMMTATAAARNMIKYKCRGSICMIASVSGTEATKGLISPVYNSSKAAVIQLARNLAMEWSPIKEDGTGGIRVNCISPGHIMTPMVRKNLAEVDGLREDWESATMMGRIAETQEFKGAALYLLSNASSYVTGSNLIVDGGHSAW